MISGSIIVLYVLCFVSQYADMRSLLKADMRENTFHNETHYLVWGKNNIHKKQSFVSCIISISSKIYNIRITIILYFYANLRPSGRFLLPILL